jgi:hypothetical protein
MGNPEKAIEFKPTASIIDDVIPRPSLERIWAFVTASTRTETKEVRQLRKKSSINRHREDETDQLISSI